MSIYTRILEFAGHDADCATRPACPTNCSRYRASLLKSPRATTIDLESASEWAAEAVTLMAERGMVIPEWIRRARLGGGR